MSTKVLNLLYLLVFLLLFILLVGSSFYRFVILKDYTVFYETDCDVTIESCFASCTKDQCSDGYNFKKISRNASTLFKLCGSNIKNCDAAKTCAQNDSTCSIVYCQKAVDNNCALKES